MQPAEWQGTRFQLVDTGGCSARVRTLARGGARRAAAPSPRRICCTRGDGGRGWCRRPRDRAGRAWANVPACSPSQDRYRRARSGAMEFYQLGVDDCSRSRPNTRHGVGELLDAILQQLRGRQRVRALLWLPAPLFCASGFSRKNDPAEEENPSISKKTRSRGCDRRAAERGKSSLGTACARRDDRQRDARHHARCGGRRAHRHRRQFRIVDTAASAGPARGQERADRVGHCAARAARHRGCRCGGAHVTQRGRNRPGRRDRRRSGSRRPRRDHRRQQVDLMKGRGPTS